MNPELVNRARNGDRAAFAELARASFDQLFRTARLILRDDDRAADAVQDALLSAWLHVRAIREPERFEAWLQRLLVRGCYREARRFTRRRVREIPIAPAHVLSATDVQFDVALRDQLARGFERLTVEHRAVLVLHHYLGLPDADAAAAIGVAIGTYKSRLNRASTALRAELEADARIPARTQESLT